ncbi:uncharacterized protein [Bos mutus]|uniref:uncharacterized protein n=1 Tax=Bos mutus TaxID=72004 RepID=UPI0038B6110A
MQSPGTAPRASAGSAPPRTPRGPALAARQGGSAFLYRNPCSSAHRELCASESSRQWHPTPVLLLGKSHGWRSLTRWSTAVTLHLFGTHVGCDRHAAARRLGGQVSHCPHCRARTLGSSRPASAAQDRRVTETFPWAAVQVSKQSGLHAPFRRTDTTPPCSVATGCPAESGESPSSFQPPRGPRCVSRGPPWTAGAGGRYSLLYPALEGPRLVEKEVSCRLPLLWSGTGSGVAPPTSSGSGSGSGDARLLHRPALCVHSASQLTTEPSLPVAQTCTETPGCDLSQGRLRREGCRGEVGRGWAPGGGRGCSGPRDTEPAARSGASGNGPR